MQTAEFNHNDFTNQAEADKGLAVRFYYKDVQNQMESQAQGRPIFKEKLYIEIRVVGQRDIQAARPATFADKQRFPLHLEAFEKRMEPPTEGTPLAEWPPISRTQAEEFSFMNIKTVEQLAAVKDTNIQQFMNGYKMKEAAIKWLENSAVVADSLEKADLKAQIIDLQAQMELLLQANKSDASVIQNPSAKKAVDMHSALDTQTEVVDVTPEVVEITPDTTEAVKVPAAPAGRKTRARRAK